MNLTNRTAIFIIVSLITLASALWIACYMTFNAVLCDSTSLGFLILMGIACALIWPAAIISAVKKHNWLLIALLSAATLISTCMVVMYWEFFGDSSSLKGLVVLPIAILLAGTSIVAIFIEKLIRAVTHLMKG
ncbi:MAG TPA: hypothetical protein P5169_02040 [Kiritimatiellia bacterium]|jgi:hypothetical protein|nr:hypothetical protein [Lentisphaerota bacterium]HRV30461.1 hypothetical protein [Kiritimatiellia bacterium]